LFSLKSDWQVKSIEYADAWWGLGKQSPNNRLITREGEAYKLAGKPFQTKVTGIRSAFIAKISDEQP
jgi:hypothetical protein